jgi:hypothetical protein
VKNRCRPYQRRAKGFLVATLFSRLTLWVPCIYAATEIPGGDDGTGGAWFWILGSACIISFVLACKNLIYLNNIKWYYVDEIVADNFVSARRTRALGMLAIVLGLCGLAMLASCLM